MNQDKSQNPTHWKWLAFVALSAIATMILGIQNALEKKASFVIFTIFVFYPIILRRFGNVGINRKNLKSSILIGSSVGIIYGIIRGLILKFVPGGTIALGADLIGLAKKLETGISVGPLVFTKENFYFSAVFLFPFMVCLELYFRGILFLTLKKFIHWSGAVAVASIVQSISRRTPHSLIMGSIGGVLMQRYDNILAPSFMHGFQFFTALGIFLYLD